MSSSSIGPSVADRISFVNETIFSAQPPTQRSQRVEYRVGSCVFVARMGQGYPLPPYFVMLCLRCCLMMPSRRVLNSSSSQKGEGGWPCRQGFPAWVWSPGDRGNVKLRLGFLVTVAGASR
jgi:hypothetical protein